MLGVLDKYLQGKQYLVGNKWYVNPQHISGCSVTFAAVLLRTCRSLLGIWWFPRYTGTKTFNLRRATQIGMPGTSAWCNVLLFRRLPKTNKRPLLAINLPMDQIRIVDSMMNIYFLTTKKTSSHVYLRSKTQHRTWIRERNSENTSTCPKGQTKAVYLIETSSFVSLILLYIEKFIERPVSSWTPCCPRIKPMPSGNSLVDIILLHIEKFIENVRPFLNFQTRLLKTNSLVNTLLLHIEKFIEKVHLVLTAPSGSELIPRSIDFLQ